MTAARADELIAKYLHELEAELGSVNDTRRQELLDDVQSHIAEARAHLRQESDVDVMNILSELGTPSDLASAEIGESQEASGRNVEGNGLLIALGTLVGLLLMWPIGVALLWISSAWRRRDKLIATLVPAAGFVAAVLAWLVVKPDRMSGLATGVIAFLFLVVVTVAYLTFALLRNSQAKPGRSPAPLA